MAPTYSKFSGKPLEICISLVDRIPKVGAVVIGVGEAIIHKIL